MSMSFAWDSDFPKGYGHTSIAYLKRCPGYEDAKNGEFSAALIVVDKCVKKDRIKSLINQYPDTILIPVISRNLLPLALAQAIGLPVWKNIYLLHLVQRKSLGSFQRLIHKPIFDGYIKSNKTYILVDDVITQGGTIAALREFVMIRGGTVVAVVALAFAFGSHYIAPKKSSIVRLLVKFGTPLLHLLQSLGITVEIEGLTNMQIRYLLRFSSIRNIFYKFIYIDSKEYENRLLVN